MHWNSSACNEWFNNNMQSRYASLSQSVFEKHCFQIVYGLTHMLINWRFSACIFSSNSHFIMDLYSHSNCWHTVVATVSVCRGGTWAPSKVKLRNNKQTRGQKKQDQEWMWRVPAYFIWFIQLSFCKRKSHGEVPKSKKRSETPHRVAKTP